MMYSIQCLQYFFTIISLVLCTADMILLLPYIVGTVFALLSIKNQIDLIWVFC